MRKRNFYTFNNLKNRKPVIVDSTLRDGSHAIRHQFNKGQLETYSSRAEKAGVKMLIVGHGNGLGASSLHLGKSKLTDHEMIRVVKSSTHRIKVGAFIIPGFGTIKTDLKPAVENGIQVLMVAANCTEANITKQHIEYAKLQKLKTYGVLMMSHILPAKDLLVQAKLMEKFGADGVILMDSAGAYLPEDVYSKINALVQGLSIDVGFHAHNNLSLAVVNSLIALDSGANIIDTTSRGLGAGAGNCQLEVIVAILHKLGVETGLHLFSLMDNAEYIAKEVMQKAQEINSITLTSGIAGVFSGFAVHAKKASENFNVDIRDILTELGKEGVVAGQEDIIIKVASRLAQKKRRKTI